MSWLHPAFGSQSIFLCTSKKEYGQCLREFYTQVHLILLTFYYMKLHHIAIPNDKKSWRKKVVGTQEEEQNVEAVSSSSQTLSQGIND